MAALMGMGLVASPSMSRHKGKSLRCHLLRAGQSPDWKAAIRALYVPRNDVSHDRDDAAAADGHQGKRQAVVPGKNGQVGQGKDSGDA